MLVLIKKTANATTLEESLQKLELAHLECGGTVKVERNKYGEIIFSCEKCETIEKIELRSYDEHERIRLVKTINGKEDFFKFIHEIHELALLNGTKGLISYHNNQYRIKKEIAQEKEREIKRQRIFAVIIVSMILFLICASSAIIWQIGKMLF